MKFYNFSNLPVMFDKVTCKERGIIKLDLDKHFCYTLYTYEYLINILCEDFIIVSEEKSEDKSPLTENDVFNMKKMSDYKQDLQDIIGLGDCKYIFHLIMEFVYGFCIQIKNHK